LALIEPDGFDTYARLLGETPDGQGVHTGASVVTVHASQKLDHVDHL
jgi:hypothetical protein